MKRSPLKRKTPLRSRRRPVNDGDKARGWRGAVMRRSNGLSVLSGEQAYVCHHVVTRQKLRKAGLGKLVWDAANGIALTEKEHAAHHSRLRPLPFSCLPECAVEFADEHGFGDWLRRHYPPDHLLASRTTVLGED